MAMIVQELPAVGALVEVSSDGTTWHEVGGAAAYDEEGGDASVSTLETFAGASVATGPPQVPTVTVRVDAYNPGLPAFTALQTAYENATSLTVRFTTQRQVLWMGTGGNTAAVATDGVVTFAGSEPPPTDGSVLKPGQHLEIGSNRLVIISVSSTEVRVFRPASATAIPAASYEVVRPSYRRETLARIVNYGNVSAAAGTNLTSSFRFQPPSQLADWEVVGP